MPFAPTYRYATMYDLATDRLKLIRPKGDFWLQLWARDSELQRALAKQEETALLDWVSEALRKNIFTVPAESAAVQHLGFLAERTPGSSGEFLAAVMAGAANKIDESVLDPSLRHWCWGKCAEDTKVRCLGDKCLAFRTGVGHHHHTRAEDVAHAGPGPRKPAVSTPKEADKNVLGHGTYSEVDDDVTVPKGVTIHFWTHRDRVLNKIEKARAIITDSAPVDTKSPGETVENLLVSPLKPGEAKESAHATRYLKNHYEVGSGDGDIYLCGDSMDGTLKCYFYDAVDGHHHPDCQGLLGRKGPLKDVITQGGVINFWTCREKGMTTPKESDPRQEYTQEQSDYHNEMAAYVQSLLDLRKTNPVLAYLQMASTAHGTRYDLDVVPLDSKEAATHILNRTEPRVDLLSLDRAERAEQIRLVWARLQDLEPWEQENLFKRPTWQQAYSELCDRRDRAVYATETFRVLIRDVEQAYGELCDRRDRKVYATEAFRGLILGVQAAGPCNLPTGVMDAGLGCLKAFASAVESYFYYQPGSEAGIELAGFCASLRCAAEGTMAIAAVEALAAGLEYLLGPTPTEQALGRVERELPLPW
ncbi:putative adhesin [Streptomyces sp. NBC_01264]|uniref:putative adhesin n=1 Tax=Streptomyces sp. NBC_01264 TaxID=2903804 RepID=UPI002250BA82|nr:hypothetical protein [Streptomyces sp. NBC_01264]MCX4781677.1 hypothetical protein [Streptomyces sp. NBC_01264]